LLTTSIFAIKFKNNYMKKVFAILSVAVVFAACGNGGAKAPAADSTKVDSTKVAPVVDSTKKDTTKLVIDSTKKDSTKK